MMIQSWIPSIIARFKTFSGFVKMEGKINGMVKMCRADEFKKVLSWAESIETYKKKDHSGEMFHLNNNLNYILPLKQHTFKGM